MDGWQAKVSRADSDKKVEPFFSKEVCQGILQQQRELEAGRINVPPYKGDRQTAIDILKSFYEKDCKVKN